MLYSVKKIVMPESHNLRSELNSFVWEGLKINVKCYTKIVKMRKKKLP